jgi:nitronate monooxygenase
MAVASLDLVVPVIAAPMAGGPSTPALVAAVAEAGGMGFLAAGYRDADQVAAQIRAVRGLTARPFGVNVFVPGDPALGPAALGPAALGPAALDRYAARLEPVAARLGVKPGQPRWDDDDYRAKLALLTADPVPVVSFTFGAPAGQDVARLRQAGSLVMITVTSVSEAAAAVDAGADALCVQGAEAGAHQGSFRDDPAGRPGAAATPLLPLLHQIRATAAVPLVAAGGLMSGADIATVLAAGAGAAVLGTAFLCCPEAGTSDTHRRALLSGDYTGTGFTRAFTGRTARGLVNAFVREHGEYAPAGYPWVHHLTRPIRAAAAEQGDADALHLWAGEGWRRIRQLPAADLVATLAP